MKIHRMMSGKHELDCEEVHDAQVRYSSMITLEIGNAHHVHAIVRLRHSGTPSQIWGSEIMEPAQNSEDNGGGSNEVRDPAA